MLKAAILGYYGYGNFGDDILMLEGLKTLFKGWDLQVYAATTESKYPVFNLEEVNKCNLIVIGGGELVHRDRLFFYSSLVKHTSIPAFLHRWFSFGWTGGLKVPKVVLGCGLESKDGYVTGSVYSDLYSSRFIGLRDVWSLEKLKATTLRNVGFFPDLSYALPLKRSTSKIQRDLAVVIPTNRSYLDTVNDSRKWLVYTLAKYREVVFIPFGSKDNDDYITCLQLSTSFKNSTVIEPKDVTLPLVIDYLSKCDLSVSYRLHGVLLSHILGVKSKVWCYHPKINHMLNTIKNNSVESLRNQQQKMFKQVLESITHE